MAKAPAFDLSSVTVEDAEYSEIKSTRTRSSKYAESPLHDPLLESYLTDQTKRLPAVPNDQVDAVRRELRGVARVIEVADDDDNVTVGIGVRIKVVPNEDGKTSTVVFLGKEMRGRGNTEDAGEESDDAE